MSHTALVYHIVLVTYRRSRVIVQDKENLLYRFIYEFLTKRDIHVRRIGGMPDHVHILCDIPAKYSLADVVRSLKSESSKYLRHSGHFAYWESWSSGYGAFTVSAAQCENVRQYILNQRSHHEGRTFEMEYRGLLSGAGFADSTSVLGDEDIA